MMDGGRLTYRGRRLAFLFAMILVLALPKKTPCLVPGNACEPTGDEGETCRPTDLEPLGVFAIEWITGSDLGVQYRRWLDCT